MDNNLDNPLAEQLKAKLKELFQFDKSDLDFGIYKILNYKRKEIEKFIEDDLIHEIEDTFKEKFHEVTLRNFKKAKEEVENTLGKTAFDGTTLKEEFKETPVGKRYIKAKEELELIHTSDTIKKELYNHLINFFSRYYDKGDFISKRRYSQKEKYVIPYNGEEVVLYWANRDQYYIKTTEYFWKYSFEKNLADGTYKINFIVVRSDEEKNNAKGNDTRYFVPHEKIAEFDEATKTFNIYFDYRTLTDEEKKLYKNGNGIKQETINEDILNKVWKKIPPNSNLLTVKEDIAKHLQRFTKRNTTDYFIHKDLKGFLERELDFYIKNEYLGLDDLENLKYNREKLDKYLRGLDVLRKIAGKIIDFLAQIENFQKKLWEKKKFVTGTEYVITLDKIMEYAGEDFLNEMADEILRNEAQLAEWKALFGEEVKAKDDLIVKNSKTLFDGVQYKKLPLDTKHFGEDFKWRFLAAVSAGHSLDDILDGILIKSENYQALNLLQNKYRERIKTVYIDPPYNTGSDDFLYKDNYQHSSWLTMMENRLELAKEIMNDTGTFFSNISDEEVDYYGILLKENFGQNKTDKIIWKKASEGRWGKMKNVNTFRKDHEYIMVSYKDIEKLNKIKEKPNWQNTYGNPDNDPRGPYKPGSISKKEEASNPSHKYYYTVVSPSGKKFTRQFEISKEEFEALDKDNRIYWGKNGDAVPAIKIFVNEEREITPYSILIEKGTNTEAKKEFIDILGKKYEGIVHNLNPKPTLLIKTLIQISTETHSNVIDFFAGSGTTAHAVMKLNAEDGGKRKFILAEMAYYFDTVILPRIKKVAYSFNWKDGKPLDGDGPGVFFKYHTLEQYEDTLENIDFIDIGHKKLSEIMPDYIFYMLEWETRQSPVFLNVEKMQNPFDYKLKVYRNQKTEETAADLIETFNYLLGLHIDRYEEAEHEGHRYRLVYGNKDGKKLMIVWRNMKDLDLEKDKAFIESKMEAHRPDQVYINGEAAVKGFKHIEPEFKTLMFQNL